MPHRRFMVVWIAVLVVLVLLAGWLAFSPALSNRSRAAAAYQQAAVSATQSSPGKLPVQVGISVEKISDFSVKNVAWNADFYVWFRWTQPADDAQFDPANTFEIASG